MSAQRRLIDRFLSATLSEGDPQAYVDWLVVQQTCEWCGDTIQHYAPDGQRLVPKAEWRCWVVKKGGYTSKHWKHWRICSTCHTKDPAQFGRWIFPIIATLPEHESLSALVQVQPMNAPAGEIMYMDFIYGPDEREGGVRGRRRHGVVLDDDFNVTPEHARAYAERPLNPDNYVMLNYRITEQGVERTVKSPNGVFNL